MHSIKNKLKSEVRAVARWAIRWCLKQLNDGEVLIARRIIWYQISGAAKDKARRSNSNYERKMLE